MSSIRPKKSESLEIRLSLEAKSAFMAHCQAQGSTASETLRSLIESDMAAPIRPSRRSWRSLVTAAAAGLAIGAVAGPSFAHSPQNARAAFDRLDRDHDGVLSFDEFRGR